MAPSYWSVLQLHGTHERTAMCLLARAGYEIYRPLTVERRLVRGCRQDVPQPLFPGYVFILIVTGRFWDAAHCVGVIKLLRNGDKPAVVADGVIADLRQRERNGYIHLPKPPGLQCGDRIYVRRGPLEGLCGLYAGQPSRERVVILLSLLNGQRRVVLPKGDVARV